VAARAPFSDQSDLDIPGLVRYVRVELRLTQSEFGALLGVKCETVSTWENGHKAPPIFKQRLIEGFAESVAQGVVAHLPRVLETCGPAVALWRVLDVAYRVDA